MNELDVAPQESPPGAAWPLVSIVVPTRDRGAALRGCLDSLRAQSYPPDRFEILVIDDGSREPLEQVLGPGGGNGGPRLRFLRQSARGANAARNLGLRESTGALVALVDDDTDAPPDWLASLVAGLVNAGADVATGPVRLRVGQPLPVKHDELHSYLAEVAVPATAQPVSETLVPVACNMLARRELFGRALFDESVRAPVEEVDWTLRAGPRVAFVPSAWLWHDKSAARWRIGSLLGFAWRRGRERGWWLRVRRRLPRLQRAAFAAAAARTAARALAHGAVQRCWGGPIIMAGELGYALALLGLLEARRR